MIDASLSTLISHGCKEQTFKSMHKNGFYNTLPRNASLQLYPNNKIWNNRTKLEWPVVLKEPPEVSFVEVQFSWGCNSFSETDTVVIIYDSTYCSTLNLVTVLSDRHLL